MKIDSKAFQDGFPEQKASQGIDPEKVNEHMKKFYDDDPVYSKESMVQVKAQVQKMCNYMNDLGLENFSSLASKFNSDLGKEEDVKLLMQIKENMEAILYKVDNSGKDPKEIAGQYKDRSFLCKEGTLQNLQNILGEMSIGTQGIEVFIAEQKKQLVVQTAADMYNKGQFTDYPWVYRQYKPMEIHNVNSIVNSVAPEYGLQVISKQEDKYVREVFNSSKKKLANKLEEQLQSEEVANSFVSGIATNIVLNLPHYEKDKYENMNQFTQEVSDYMRDLKLNGEFGASTFLELDGYSPKGYKQNIQSIMEDVITLHLHKEGVVQHPEIELVEMRVALEKNSDAVTKEILEEAKENGYLEKATKYMIDNKLKLDMDEYSDDPFEHQDPVKYAIENNIKIEGKDAKQYALEKVIEDYLKAPNPEIKKELDTRYKEIHQMGSEKTSELLSVDSNLGKFLDNAKNIEVIKNHSAAKGSSVLQDIDYTKCDLALIEKCKNVNEKSLKEKPRNYDNFTTAQKVGMAFSTLLGPVGPVVVYFAIKAHNKAEKAALEKQIGQSIEGIQEDLGKLSKEIKKLEPDASKSVSFKEPTTEPIAVKQSLKTQNEGLENERKPTPKDVPLAKNNSLIHKKLIQTSQKLGSTISSLSKTTEKVTPKTNRVSRSSSIGF